MKIKSLVTEGEKYEHAVFKLKTVEVVKQLENILKILIVPKGLKAGQTLYGCTTGYQWLF